MHSSCNSVAFEIKTSMGRYPVEVGVDLLDKTLAESIDRVWIVDSYFSDRFHALGIDAVMIHAEEPTKSLDRMTEVIVALRERGVTRKTQLVAVGGGVTQDVAAFVAAIYMRGIDYLYLPTTLLSMADSCIGGKSSINVGKYKNIVGTVAPPAEVRIDPAFTTTLSREQIAEGLCEAAKICLCGGADVFDGYLALDPTVDADEATMTATIAHALKTKAWFIEIDEFDKNERLLLNFGHTFGHAIEAASGFDISHGIGVGLGMLAALQFGESVGLDYTAMPHVARFKAHIAALLGAVDGLDASLARLHEAALLDAFNSDKKHLRDAFAIILVNEAGAVERRMFARDAVTTRAVAGAFASLGAVPLRIAA